MIKRFTAAAAAFTALAGAAHASTFDSVDRERYLMMFDTNRDGAVTKQEFVQHAEIIWAKIEAKKEERPSNSSASKRQFELFLEQLKKSDG